jgi:argininosuccinate lyase
MKGLPMTYNRDMQEDKEPLFDAADQVNGSLEMARAVVAESVVLRRRVPAAAAEESWVVATDLAEALARAGTPFHQAHQIVGRWCSKACAAARSRPTGRRRRWRSSRPNSRRYGALLDPREGMKTREIPGGTGPRSVAAALAAARERLARMA